MTIIQITMNNNNEIMNSSTGSSRVSTQLLSCFACSSKNHNNQCPFATPVYNPHFNKLNENRQNGFSRSLLFPVEQEFISVFVAIINVSLFTLKCLLQVHYAVLYFNKFKTTKLFQIQSEVDYEFVVYPIYNIENFILRFVLCQHKGLTEITRDDRGS